MCTGESPFAWGARDPLNSPPKSRRTLSWPVLQSAPGNAAIGSLLSDDNFPKETVMQTVEETLKLLKRQMELETAIRQKGGFRISEEQELRALKRRLAEYPEAIRAVLQASHALRRPLSEIGVEDVEAWVPTTTAS
jgi:hypothetical protein